ncbi:MAG: O-antigen ligase family protein [Pseudomonadota bacterium]
MIEIAYLAMLSYPILVVVLFSRFDVQYAIAWSIMFGMLFLPQGLGFNPPLLPKLDRTSMPAFCVLALAVVTIRGRGWSRADGQERFLTTWVPKDWMVRALLVSMIAVIPLLTFITNRDPIPAPASIRGLSVKDLGAMVYGALTTVVLVTVGRRFLSDERGQQILLIVLALGGLIYAPLVMLEWRLSPQLHNWIYGHVVFEWQMTRRWDGWRPVVFFKNGLAMSIFMVTAFIASIAAVRYFSADRKIIWRFGSGVLFVTVLLLNSLSAWAVAVVFASVIAFFNRRLQLLVAGATAVMVLIYPLTQISGMFPNNTVVGMAAMLDEGRAGSLQYRLDHEAIIMEKANERPIFGWGIWGRGRVYNEEGSKISTTDSMWILEYSEFGIIGYVIIFGLICFPVLYIFVHRRRLNPNYVTIGLCLVCCGLMVDQMINATMNSYGWIAAGSLLGWAERRRVAAAAMQAQGALDVRAAAGDRSGGSLATNRALATGARQRLAGTRGTSALQLKRGGDVQLEPIDQR